MTSRLLSVSNCLVVAVVVLFVGTEVGWADEQQTAKLLKTFIGEFELITPGEGRFPARFEMGDDEGEAAERPRHTVTLTKPFAIARYEVPQNLYEAVMGNNPSRWKGPRNSVEMMSWTEANDFCKKVTLVGRSQKLIGDDQTIRLPTEAEWEYCCRAGTPTRYSFGDQPQRPGDVSPKASILSEYAWHTGNAAGNDPPVGALKPNPWGLYDMHGYLWEFTADAWMPNYEQASTDGSAAAPQGETNEIVIRGGSWKDGYNKLTSSARRRLSRVEKDDAVGFRCVLTKRTD
jgi:formylglycine-generating enzyme required for sulfatase activity